MSLQYSGLHKSSVMSVSAAGLQWPDLLRQSLELDEHVTALKLESRPEHPDQSFGPVARHYSDLWIRSALSIAPVQKFAWPYAVPESEKAWSRQNHPPAQAPVNEYLPQQDPPMPLLPRSRCYWQPQSAGYRFWSPDRYLYHPYG